MSYGERIRAALDAKGRKIADLAAHLGISPQSVSQFVNGHRSGLTHADAIANFLGVPVEYLTTGANPPPWDRAGRVAQVRATYEATGQSMDLVAEVVAGDGVVPMTTINPEIDQRAEQYVTHEPRRCQFPSTWKLVQVHGTSAYPVIYPGQFAIIDTGRSCSPPFSEAMLHDLHDNVVIVQTTDGRAFLKNFCWASGAPGDFLLTSIDGGKSSPWVAPDDILVVIPVVGSIWKDPAAPREKMWHHKRVMDARGQFLQTNEHEVDET